MQQGGMSKFKTGLWNLWSGWTGNREVGQGWAYGVPKQVKGLRLELGNRKVIETKQGSLEMRIGWGEVRGQSSSMGLHRV